MSMTVMPEVSRPGDGKTFFTQLFSFYFFGAFNHGTHGRWLIMCVGHHQVRDFQILQGVGVSGTCVLPGGRGGGAATYRVVVGNDFLLQDQDDIDEDDERVEGFKARHVVSADSGRET
jgi:hypothetical protein